MAFWLFLLLCGVVVWQLWRRRGRKLALRERIELYRLPAVARRKWLDRYSQLGPEEYQLAEAALRQFFLAYLLCRKPLAMPSRAADGLWHEFILCTREYADFCQSAFGEFFHHTPASEPNEAGHQRDLLRCWRQVCQIEGINPDHPLRLPLLFGLDRKLAIEDGIYYSQDLTDQVSVLIQGRRYYRVPRKLLGRREDSCGGSGGSGGCSGGSCSNDGDGDGGGGGCGGGGD